MSDDQPPLKALSSTFPQVGRLGWIGVRPSDGAPMQELAAVQATPEGGLAGDRFDGGATRQRQVTLIQSEHLQAIGDIMRRKAIPPTLTRRNLVISGINLRALLHSRFRVGSVVFEGTSECPPCSQMERNLGPGGYNAMRGHGGICARIVQGGELKLGDEVEFLSLLEREPS